MKVKILLSVLSFLALTPVAFADSVTLSPLTTVDDNTGSIGTVAWVNPNNAQVSDNVYSTVTSGGGYVQAHYLKATNFGFSIPTGATIDGILIEFEQKSNISGATGDSVVKAVKANSFVAYNLAGGYMWPLSDTYKSYGSASTLWGTTWTPEDINASNFGVAIAPYLYNAASVVASIDHIRITVYYTYIPPPVDIINSISSTTSIFEKTTGFDIMKLASTTGNGLVKLFVGNGLAIISQLRGWIVALVIIGAILLFAGRAFRFFKH